MIEGLVDQIEARYAVAQAQMSDPEVISDRKRYADAGRLYMLNEDSSQWVLRAGIPDPQSLSVPPGRHFDFRRS